MAKKSKSKFVKNFIIVGSILAVLQIGFIYFFSPKTTATSPREAINGAVNKIADASPEKKEMARVQLALADYMGEHKGQMPKALDELVPKYFDKVPQDPTTGKAFFYKVDGNKFLLGEQGTTTKAPPGKDSSGKNSSSKGIAPSEGEEDLPLTDEERAAVLASLSDDSIQDHPPYDPSGKRDPFRPVDLSPKTDMDDSKTPLERVAIDQLTYSAYISSEDEPKAVIENQDGRGYTVAKGTKVGPNGGEVVDIFPDKIVIVESEVDFTGDKRSRTIELAIGVKAETTQTRHQN